MPPLPIPFFRAARPIVRASKGIAKELIERDPLNIISEDAVMMAMVNDPNFVMTDEMQTMINDPNTLLVSDGENMMKINGSNVMRRSSQFRRDKLLPRNGRKKTKTDKMMSKALREANARLRTKKGMLRKGKTQADVMRLAHRLRKKM